MYDACTAKLSDDHRDHKRYALGDFSHDAGYDSNITARILIRFMGNYQTHLQLMDDQGSRSQRKAREKVVEFINRGGTFAVDVSESTAIPQFDSPLWLPLINVLRVNGTHEGLIRLEN